MCITLCYIFIITNHPELPIFILRCCPPAIYHLSSLLCCSALKRYRSERIDDIILVFAETWRFEATLHIRLADTMTLLHFPVQVCWVSSKMQLSELRRRRTKGRSRSRAEEALVTHMAYRRGQISSRTGSATTVCECSHHASDK
jgi:hypothetical protein